MSSHSPRSNSLAAADRHTLQMCSEVRRALDLILTGECDDDVLRGLYVEQVIPALIFIATAIYGLAWVFHRLLTL